MNMLLHIADHFDTLASGKTLAVGLFADRVVVMHVAADAAPPSAALPYGCDLALLLTLTSAPAGPLQGQLRVIPPGAGEPVAAIEFNAVAGGPGLSVSVMTRLRPLLVPQAGTYTVEVTAAGQTLASSFEVRVNRAGAAPPQALGPAPGAPPARRRHKPKA